MFSLIFLSILITPSISDDSCNKECFLDKMPLCGTWMKEESNSLVPGTYELNYGIVNMSCTFTSLPEPATVSWVYKAPNSNNWNDFACSTKVENKYCGETEHQVQSRCILRTTDLEMTGSYRCEAANPALQSGFTQSFGSEVAINVVGVAKTEVVDYSLPFGKMGHINVEICSNPKPEVFWVTSEAIVSAHKGTPRIAATHMHHKKERATEDGPATTVPYCYTSQLLIRTVHQNDSFKLIVKADGKSTTVALPVAVTGVPVSSSTIAYRVVSFVSMVVYLLY